MHFTTLNRGIFAAVLLSLTACSENSSAADGASVPDAAQIELAAQTCVSCHKAAMALPDQSLDELIASIKAIRDKGAHPTPLDNLSDDDVAALAALLLE